MSDPANSPASNSLLTFEQAQERSPLRPLVKPLEGWVAQGCIFCFIVLSTILGVIEMPFVSQETYRAFIGLGAPIGMKQSWRLFGPGVRTYNWHTLVLVEFADGTVQAQEFPRMDKLSLLERFMREKERSVLGDRLGFVKFRRYWPVVARFYARANYDPENPPKKVTFLFASAAVPPPEPQHWVFRDNMPEHSYRQVYLVYLVTPADLKNVVPGKGP